MATHPIPVPQGKRLVELEADDEGNVQQLIIVPGKGFVVLRFRKDGICDKFAVCSGKRRYSFLPRRAGAGKGSRRQRRGGGGR